MIKSILFISLLFIVGCGDKGKIQHREYFINSTWQTCDYISTEACGEKLNCSGVVYSCQTNMQTRTVD